MKILNVVALCVAGSIAFEAHALPVYKATRLDFSATTLNNRGQIIGENSGGTVLWRKGETVQLGVSGAVDINDRGTILGSDWLWDRNGLTQGAFAGAVALNNQGQVAGNLPRDRAFTWDQDNGVVQIKISEEDGGFGVNGIADDGTVLLRWDLWNGGYGVWNSETENSPLPNVLNDCCVNTNAVMNSRGYIAGLSLTGTLVPDLPPVADDCGGNGCYAIAIWTPELSPTYVGLQSLTEFTFPGYLGARSGVTGVNDDLLIVGSYQSFEHIDYRAYVGSAELGVLDLNGLLTRQAQSLIGGATLQAAQGINDRGWIIAKAKDGASYLLRTVPEPGMLALLCVALGALSVINRRKSRAS